MDTRDITESAQEWQEKAKNLGQQAREQALYFQERARQAALDAGRATDQYVRENPWKMVLIATLAGCAIGLLLSRSND